MIFPHILSHATITGIMADSLNTNPNLNPALDERWLKRSLFLASHRALLKQGVLATIIIIEAALVFWSGYHWLDYFVFSQPREAALLEELSRSLDYGVINQTIAPLPLTVETVVILPTQGASGKYDILTKISNPNKAWAAMFEYAFEGVDDSDSETEETFILNDESRFIIGAGAVSSLGAAPNFVLKTVRWQRLHSVERFNSLKPQFTVSDVNFVPATGSLSDNEGLPNQINFIVKNDGPADYWSVGFIVILMRGESPLAARYTTLEQVRSGDSRNVSLNIYGLVGSAATVLVVPEVNVLDSSVFMRTGGEPIKF